MLCPQERENRTQFKNDSVRFWLDNVSEGEELEATLWRKEFPKGAENCSLTSGKGKGGG